MNLLEQISNDADLIQAKHTLIGMKKSLEEYKLKNDAIPKYVEQREKILASLTKYIISSEENIELLKEYNKQAKKEGLRQGIERNQNIIDNLLNYGTTTKPSTRQEKESARAYSKLKAIETWPELY